MKKMILVLVLAFIAVCAFGTTVSQHVDFGVAGFNFFESTYRVNVTMATVSYRYIQYPKDFGFYVGFDGTTAFPTIRTIYGNDNFATSRALYAHGLFLMMPLGYRWQGKDKPTAFFIGGGPSMQFLYGFNTGTLFGLGVTSELGYETNMTEGSDFHFIFQFGWSPGMWQDNLGYLGPGGFIAALRFGITWRRVQTAG